ncbi:MAG: ferredoxin [Bacteroidales bacterium]|nr:ferredoxin [Bacteroidales bacterium]
MYKEEDFNDEYVLTVAKQMCVAARTAPKARGTDNLIIRICDKDDIRNISEQLVKDYEMTDCKEQFLLRDSQNILSASYIVLIATQNKPLGLNCGWCGFESCGLKNQMNKQVPCFFNSEDLGLAIGSAVSVATDSRVDTRVMFSAGRAASRLGMVNNCVQCLAISLSASAKNPFFDRK